MRAGKAGASAFQLMQPRQICSEPADKLLHKMQIYAVIPARYHSTRLPGKPILKKTGKYLVQHVYERASQARTVAKVIVATDDQRVCDAVRSFGGEVIMTSSEHLSGTDRVAEVAENTDAGAYINVQGDEPEILPEMIDAVGELLADPRAGIATLAVRSSDIERFYNPNTVKVVTDLEGFALYFSRSPIPGSKQLDEWAESPAFSFLVHVGIYGYRRDFLMKFAQLPAGRLESLENLEQLRALENGFRIKTGTATHEPTGIDTPEDYERFVRRYSNAEPLMDTNGHQ